MVCAKRDPAKTRSNSRPLGLNKGGGRRMAERETRRDANMDSCRGTFNREMLGGGEKRTPLGSFTCYLHGKREGSNLRPTILSLGKRKKGDR